MSYTDFISENIAPYLANKIGVYDSNGNRVGKIPLGDFKPSYGNRLYRFGLLSDVHNQSDQSAESTEDLQRALAYFNEKESVWATCICGDITQKGSLESEYQLYQNNVNAKSPNTPVYTCTGNHDCINRNGINEIYWKTYTGHDICFEITKGNDHFLFFGMYYYSLGASGNPYRNTDIDWIENKLEEYRNERCFVFTHLFIPKMAGNFKEIYPSGNWLGGSQLTRIQELVEHYKNSIWFSGHSHWKWYLQKYEEKANIYKNNSAWTVHVPSCASPIDSDGTSTRVSMPLESEGAIVDVYENYIDIRGMDLKNQKYLPIAQYRLDTTLVNIDAKPIVTYAITNNLTNVTNSNTTTEITEGSSYSANISANEGYTLNSLTVTMNGTDITSTAVNGSNINIESVTGDIVITASASITTVACTGISLNNTSLSFTDTNAQTLVVTVTPSDTTDTITWESSNTSITTVSNGVVTPTGNGDCIITARCGSQSATCNVNVSLPKPDTNLTWTRTKISSSDGSETSTESATSNIYIASNYVDFNTAYSYALTFNKTKSDMPQTGTISYNAKICYYDADKKFLSCSSALVETNTEVISNLNIAVIENAKYIRVRGYVARADSEAPFKEALSISCN